MTIAQVFASMMNEDKIVKKSIYNKIMSQYKMSQIVIDKLTVNIRHAVANTCFLITQIASTETCTGSCVNVNAVCEIHN